MALLIVTTLRIYAKGRDKEEQDWMECLGRGAPTSDAALRLFKTWRTAVAEDQRGGTPQAPAVLITVEFMGQDRPPYNR